MWDVWNASGEFINVGDSFDDVKMLAKNAYDSCEWADGRAYVLARQHGTKLVFRVCYQEPYAVTLSHQEVK